MEAEFAMAVDVLKEMGHDVIAAVKATQTVGNKSGELKKVVNSFRKRIEKLEK